MLILGIDPGVESPGYAVWCSEQQRHVYIGSECPSMRVDCAVVERGFIGRIGKLGMWGLGFGAGWRICQASAIASACYSIRPDGKTGWRAALPELPDAFKKYDGVPKAVCVARLRVRYVATSRPTDDMIEACGIAEAAAAILARPKASQRKALKPVRF
jgi:hypothetical protein